MHFFLGLATKRCKAFLAAYPGASSGIEGKTSDELRKAYLKSLPKRARLIEERLRKVDG